MRLHIEVVGIPGSGKSTWVNGLIELMNGGGRTAYTLRKAARIPTNRAKTGRYKKYALNFLSRKLLNEEIRHTSNESGQTDSFLSFMIDNPELFEFVFHNQIERNYKEWERKHDITYFFQLCSMFQTVKNELKEHESVVIDEGFTYIPIRTLGHGDKIIDEYITRYMTLIPRPDVLVRISCDPVVCDDRMLQRKSGHPSRLGTRERDDRIRFLELCQRYIDFVTDAVSGIGVNIINIDTSKDPDETRKKLENEISVYMSTHDN
jgi:thymidylate kinase